MERCPTCNTPLDDAAKCVTCAAKAEGLTLLVRNDYADEGYVLKALKAGARAYLLKDSAEYDLISAIKAVAEGKASFCSGVDTGGATGDSLGWRNRK